MQSSTTPTTSSAVGTPKVVITHPTEDTSATPLLISTDSDLTHTPPTLHDDAMRRVKSTSSLQALKDRSLKRKQLLAQSLGIQSPFELSSRLGKSLAHDPSDMGIVRKTGDQFGSTSNLDSLDTSSGNLPGGPPQYSTSTSLLSLVPITSASGHKIAATPFVIAAMNQQTPTGGGGSSANSDAGSLKGVKTARRKDADDFEEGMIDDYYKVLQEEEQVYKSSKTFLKGTQSANPHNDYSQHFVDTGQRPQNFIRDPGLNERFEEYPKLKELIKLKDDLVQDTNTPPMYIRADLAHFDLKELESRFDVILIEPPLEEDQRKLGIISGKESWTWDMIEQLDIGSIADNRCFLWIWCGSSPEGTLRGRQCLRRWGFRRCEDICWVKRNTKHPGKRQQLEPGALFHRSKEHCLMGIKGTVRRSTDGDFIHANVDIDLIISEEPDLDIGEDPRLKPEEIFLVAEHFCLGRRRLHLFGRDDTLRPGWVTVGPEVTSTTYHSSKYRSFFEKSPYTTTGCTERIQTLRPKSPERGGGKGGGGGVGGGGDKGGGGRGGGRGGGGNRGGGRGGPQMGRGGGGVNRGGGVGRVGGRGDGRGMRGGDRGRGRPGDRMHPSPGMRPQQGSGPRPQGSKGPADGGGLRRDQMQQRRADGGPLPPRGPPRDFSDASQSDRRHPPSGERFKRPPLPDPKMAASSRVRHHYQNVFNHSRPPHHQPMSGGGRRLPPPRDQSGPSRDRGYAHTSDYAQQGHKRPLPPPPKHIRGPPPKKMRIMSGGHRGAQRRPQP